MLSLKNWFGTSHEAPRHGSTVFEAVMGCMGGLYSRDTVAQLLQRDVPEERGELPRRRFGCLTFFDAGYSAWDILSMADSLTSRLEKVIYAAKPGEKAATKSPAWRYSGDVSQRYKPFSNAQEAPSWSAWPSEAARQLDVSFLYAEEPPQYRVLRTSILGGSRGKCFRDFFPDDLRTVPRIGKWRVPRVRVLLMGNLLHFLATLERLNFSSEAMCSDTCFPVTQKTSVVVFQRFDSLGVDFGPTERGRREPNRGLAVELAL